MSFSLKRWLKSMSGAKARGTVRRAKPVRRPSVLSIEALEDRTVPAVTVTDLQNAVGQLRVQVKQAVDFVDAASALGANLGIINTSLHDLLDATATVDQKLGQAAGAQDMANPNSVTVYLRTAIPAATGGKVTIDYDNTTEMGFDPSDIRLRLKVNFSDTKTDLVPTLENALAGIKLGVPDGLKFGLTNSLTGYFNFEIKDADNDPATAPTVMFIRGPLAGESSRIVYNPQLNATLNNTGTLAGALAYHLTGSVTFAPTFTFAYGTNTTPVALTTIAIPTTTNVANNQLVADLRADLTSDEGARFKLPKFGYAQTYTLTFGSTGATSRLYDPAFFLNGDPINTANLSSAATTVALSVLKDAGADVVGQLDDILPKQVVDLLLGKVVLYQSGGTTLTLAGLLQAVQEQTGVPIDTPLDVLQVFGVPEPVISVIESVLQAVDVKKDLENLDENAPVDVQRTQIESIKSKLSPAGAGQNGKPKSAAELYYIGADSSALLGDILKIFKGERIPLVEYRLDLANDPYVQALADAGALTIQRDVPNLAGGLTNYVTGHIDFESDKFRKKLVDTLTSGLSGSLKENAQNLLNWAIKNVSGGLNFSLKGDMKLAAAARIGVDTTFLLPGTTGNVAEKIEKSIYVSTGNLIDFSFNVKAEIEVSLAGAAGGIVDGVFGTLGNLGTAAYEGAQNLGQQAEQSPVGQAIGDVYSTVTNGGLFLDGTGFKPLDSFLDAAGSGHASLSISGNLLFGLVDPTGVNGVVNDGRLTLYELNKIGFNNLDKVVAFATDGLLFQASGDGSIAGIHVSFDIPQVNLLPGLRFGATPESAGPNLANFDDTPVTQGVSQVAPPVFADVPTDSTILQVYGTSASDVISIAGTLDGKVAVTWNGLTKVFDPVTDHFTAIAIGLRSYFELVLLDRFAIPSSNAIISEDGGDDDVSIYPSLTATIPVIVLGGVGNDTIRGFAGDRSDLASYYTGKAVFYGGGGSDHLYGTGGTLSILYGEDGDDFLYAGRGQNLLDGGVGGDRLYGLPVGDVPIEYGRSYFIGGAGDDFISVGKVSRGDHVLIGGVLNPTTTDDPGSDIIYGGYGNETIVVGNATLSGSTLVADQSSTKRGVVMGGPGNDTIYGSAGNDRLIGGFFSDIRGSGTDTIYAGDGNDLVIGGNAATDAGGNLLAVQTTDGSATIYGGDGNDTLLGGKGNDTIYGGAGLDRIDAGAGTNYAEGGTENDTFILGRGIDTVFGQGGNDFFLLTNPTGTIYAPGGTITIDAGGQSGDVLRTSGGGGSGFSEVYTPGSGTRDGTITTRNTAGTLVQTIRFTTLPQIEDRVTVATLTVSAPASDDTIAVRNGGIIGGDDATEVFSTRFTPIRLSNKATLVVDGGGGADTISVDDVHALGLQRLNVRGGDDNDVITIRNAAAAVRTTLDGDAGDDTFNVINGSWRAFGSILNVVGGGGSNTLNITGDPFVNIARETLAVTGAGSGILVYDRRDSGGPRANGSTLDPTDSEQLNFQDMGLVNDVTPLTTGQIDLFLVDYGTTTNVGVGGVFDGVQTLAVTGAAPTIQLARKPVVTISTLSGADTVNVNLPTASAGLTELRLYGNELTDGALGLLDPTFADDGAADTFNIRANAVAVKVFGQGGADTINIASDAPTNAGRLTGIAAGVTVDGGAGADVLNVSNFGGTAGTGTLTSAKLTGFGLPTAGVAYTSIATLNLNLSNAAGADTLAIQSTAAGTATTVSGNAGADVVNVGSDLSLIAGSLALDGGAGADDLNVSNFGGAAGVGTLTGTQLTGYGMVAAGITYADFATLGIDLSNAAGADTLNVRATNAGTATTVNGNAGDDVFNVGSTGNALAPIQGALTVNGNAGNDDLNITNRGGAAGVGTLTNTKLTGFGMGAAGVTYSSVATLDIDLSIDTSADRLAIASTAAGTATRINGNGASNATTASGALVTDLINVGTDLGLLAGALTVDGGAGAGVLNVSNFGGAAGTGALTAAQLTGFGMNAAGVTYTNFSAVNIDLSDAAGGDTLAVRSTHAGPTVVRGNAGNDVVNVGNNGTLDDLLGTLAVDGGADTDALNLLDQSDATANAYGLTAAQLTRTGGKLVTYSALENFQLLGGTAGNTYTVASTGATVRTLIQDGGAGSLFTVQGDGLTAANGFRGQGGADTFVVNAGLGVTGTSVGLDGGAGSDRVYFNARTGDDSLDLALNAPTGDHTLTGMGQAIASASIEDVAIDAAGGNNSLSISDRTNVPYGSALAVAQGMIFRPTGAASGDFYLASKTMFPVVGFVNVGGTFSVNGDADGSGDRDTLTVLSTSTIGYTSPFGEFSSLNGADTIDVSDTGVSIQNAAAGALRSVALAQTNGQVTFQDLIVRGGGEVGTVGDHIRAVPSNRMNLFVDGMEPVSGDPADVLEVATVGERVFQRSRDPRFGDTHTRIVQTSDGASVGWTHIEEVGKVGVAVVAPLGGSPVRVLDVTTGQLRFELNPYPGFGGSVRVATGDLNGDAIPDIVTSIGGAGPAHIVAFDGVDGSVISSFIAFPGYLGGVSVGVGDVNGDGSGDIVVGAGVGTRPHVMAFSGADLSVVASFYAFAPGFLGGLSIGVGYADGDGLADIVIGPGTVDSSHVRVVSGARAGATKADGEISDAALLANFFAFGPTYRGGVTVALGDIDGDHLADILVGAGSGSVPRVRAVSLTRGTLADFMLNDPSATSAVPSISTENAIRVGAADMNGDGIKDIIMTKGDSYRPILFAYEDDPLGVLKQLVMYPEPKTEGLWIAGSK